MLPIVIEISTKIIYIKYKKITNKGIINYGNKFYYL